MESEFDAALDREILGHTNIFSDLDAETLDRLVAACERVKFTDGDVIFREGDPGDSAFVVEEGRVRLSKQITTDMDRTIITVTRGGFFGQTSLIDPGERAATATALEETRALSLSRDRFDAFAKEHPLHAERVLVRLARSLSSRLRLLQEQLRDAIIWGLTATGCENLHLDHLIGSSTRVEVHLLSGRAITGQIVRVGDSPAGHELTIRDEDERFHLVPYHAVVDILFHQLERR